MSRGRLIFWVSCLAVALMVGRVWAREVLPLKDDWQMQSAAALNVGGETISSSGFVPIGWYRVSVPTTVLAALVRAGVYPDPYYGDNLKSIPGYVQGRWLVMPEDSPFRRSWWYRTSFLLPGAYAGRDLRLHLDGINYRANVWLNGRLVADSEHLIGMFRRFELDVNDYARPGEQNYLAVEIIGPGQGPPPTVRTKQIEATTGWDDHNPYPPDMNMGIWQDVYLTATGPVRMRHPYVRPQLDLPGLEAAHLTVTVEAANVSKKQVTAEISGVIEKTTFAQRVTLAPGESRLIRFSPSEFPQLNLTRPRIWWPNPLGSQEMYTLRLTAKVEDKVSDVLDQRFGIRDATTYLNEEGWRVYMINGRKVLIRGAAWMTSDMLLRLSHKRYEALIRYAKEANLNMLRSEGFSIRETEDFYNLCDDYGVMVTQQIFGRSIADENLAIACVEDMILRIRNHPSLVHFLGHDETFPTLTLDQAYRALIAKHSPDRTYQPNSGAFDVQDRFATGGTRTGSRELWTYAQPTHYYTDPERGAWGFAQSGGIGGTIAPLESMRRMMPEKDLWPPWTDTWSFHTVLQGGHYYDALLAALKARYGEPSGIEDFCRKGQLMNYESARAMYEAYGRNKYSATGITAWKYNAAWPASPTWQIIDWYLLAGGAYYGAKKACEPLHLQYSYDDHSIVIVNSYYQDFSDLKVSAAIYNLDGTERFARFAVASVPADGVRRLFTIEQPPNLSKAYFLDLRLQDSSDREISRNFYWLSTVPDIPGTQGYTENGIFFISPASVADFTDLRLLPRVQVNLHAEFADRGPEQVATVTVSNPSHTIAFFVHLAVTQGEGGPEVAPTYWQDNYFSLLPGESKTVTAKFAAEDLEGKPPVIKVDGWNVTGAR